MIVKVKRDLRQSEIKKFQTAAEQGKRIPYRTRALTEEEIALLEKNGNLSSDWTRVVVAVDFDPNRIIRCRFEGDVALPRFFGTVRTPEEVSVETGLYNSTLMDAVIDNAHLSDVGLLSSVVVQQGAVIRQVGSLAAIGRTSFGIGRQLSIGTEVGGRTVITYPDLSAEGAAEILLRKGDVELQHLYQTAIEEFREEIRSDKGFVGNDACIVNTRTVRNCWIGSGAVIDGATKVSNSTVLSTLENPSLIRDGAIVEHSLLQQGCCVESNAWVSDSLLNEASSASRHARIRYAVIASNTHLKGGEVSNALLGPFIGLHHQAHIASVLWPQGLGSVGAGTLISGDPMGRTPHREGWIGEGITFGQGVTLLFPIDLSLSPWSFITSGTTLAPQKLSFPFSLIAEGECDRSSPCTTELLPGWALRKNAPALARAVKKFGERNRLRNGPPSPHFLSRSSAEAVIDALKRLQSVSEVRDLYTEKELPGLGGCFLRESARQQAIVAYKGFLERYALTQAVSELEEKPDLLRTGPVAKLLFGKEPLREITRLVSIPAQLPMIIRRYRALEKEWRDTVFETVAEERRLGIRVFDDWEATHTDPEQGMGFVSEEVKESDRRVRELLKKIQEMRG